jgi:hypothetical protein
MLRFSVADSDIVQLAAEVAADTPLPPWAGSALERTLNWAQTAMNGNLGSKFMPSHGLARIAAIAESSAGLLM